MKVCYGLLIFFLVVMGYPIRPWLVVRYLNWFISHYNSIFLSLNFSTRHFFSFSKSAIKSLSLRLQLTSTPIVPLFLAAEAEVTQAFPTPSKLDRKQIHASRIQLLAKWLIQTIYYSSGVQITHHLKRWVRDGKSYNTEKSQSKKTEKIKFTSQNTNW